MKKTIKTLIILAIITIFSVNYYNVKASFADFTDDDARSETEKMEKEQEQNFNEIKSNNNYLRDLKIDGYELTPQFDKQIVEYSLNNSTDLKELNIKATADDEKSKIEGTGKIVLKENQKECRIDVTAESGTVRTYIIKLNQKEKETESSNTDANIISDEEEINPIIEDEAINEYNENNKGTNNRNIIIVTGILIIALVIVFILKKLTNKKKTKH